MTTKTIGYWVTTGLFTAMLAMSGAMDFTHAPALVEGLHEKLGFPLSFLTILGTAKLLGVVALLVPRFPLLKEWAYAGFTFNLLGAVWTHIAEEGGIGGAIPALVLLGVMAASYALRPESRRIRTAR
jgi:hypothetical protein